MGSKIRNQAEKLRQAGWSYNIISQRLKVPKSTLSSWLKNRPYEPNKEVIRRIKNGPLISGIKKHKARLIATEEIRKKAFIEIGKLSRRDIMMLGIGIYIGEGSKLYEHVRLINSDPNVIRLSIKWFELICGLDKNNFKPTIHIYPDCSEEKSLEYWSKSTGIPVKSFGKTQIDRRKDKKEKKRKKLPYGTLHLYIVSNGELSKGVMLHRKILSWIECIYNQVRV